MSISPDPQVSLQLIEETRKQINRLFEEVARLSEMDLPPNDYYGEMLKRVLTALAAPAGAVWVRTQQGNLQLQYQINLRQVGLDRSDEARQSHDELLRQAFMQGRPLHLQPHSSAGTPEGGGPAAGNPTDYIILLAPIIVDKQVHGLIEIWQTANRHPDAIQGFLQFLNRMAELASLYTRNNMLRQMGGQQQLWSQLEAFARQVHGSLNPVEVAYVVANEGRRLIQCDRVAVAVRLGRRTSVDAISGADVVEKRSNLVQLMRKLFERVLVWGEKLVYKGVKDDSLPPDVLEALDNYLAESNSKLLVVAPLRDERQGESKRPARSAVIMECFEPATAPEQLIARLDVVARHATTALYNSVEHRRIPFRFIWQPLARVQEGLGGKARAITFLIILAIVALGCMFWFVPYPLKMDASGQLLPETRRWVYSPVEARVDHFYVEPNAVVNEDQAVVLMYDLHLANKLNELNQDIFKADRVIGMLEAQKTQSALTPTERSSIETQIVEYKAIMEARRKERDELVRRTHAEEGNPGYFRLRAPRFPDIVGTPAGGQWTVLNWNFREQLNNRYVKPSDPVLRVGYKEGPWEIELKIPQKHIGQVLAAFDYVGKDELDVDLLVRSAPTRIFKGKLHRDKIGGEARSEQNEQGEAEPVVLAAVRIEGDDIPKADQLPRELLVTGTEVTAKVRCGNHRMGYSLFYGVWEFFYEKVVFFF